MLRDLVNRLWWHLSGRGRVIRLPSLREAGRPRRALLLYLNEWWNPLDYYRKKSSHQNLHQAHDIARILQERGYACDVVHYKNKAFHVTTPYDLIISHRFDDRFLKCPKPAESRYVFLTTTQAPQIHNTVARARLEEVMRRKNSKVANFRSVSEESGFRQQADMIAAFGSESVGDGWRSIFPGPVRCFQNWPFEIPRPAGKDWSRARTGFLYLASGSQVHKGLDLILEAVQQLPEARVYVCSYFKDETDFCAAYHHELFESPNVFPIGRINVRSQHFQQLLQDTAFAILPSASEGSPGSTIQAAHGGLIPVLSRYSGVDRDECIFIEDLSVEAVTAAMRQCLAMPVEEVVTRSAAVEKWIDSSCSREKFIQSWNAILDELAGPANAGGPAPSRSHA